MNNERRLAPRPRCCGLLHTLSCTTCQGIRVTWPVPAIRPSCAPLPDRSNLAVSAGPVTGRSCSLPPAPALYPLLSVLPNLSETAGGRSCSPLNLSLCRSILQPHSYSPKQQSGELAMHFRREMHDVSHVLLYNSAQIVYRERKRSRAERGRRRRQLHR